MGLIWKIYYLLRIEKPKKLFASVTIISCTLLKEV